jgi:hypothetical protein
MCLTFIAGMFLIVRPLIQRRSWRVDESEEPVPPSALVLGLVGVLLSALGTAAIGIYADLRHLRRLLVRRDDPE